MPLAFVRDTNALAHNRKDKRTMSEVIKLVTPPNVELVEQSREQLLSNWQNNTASGDPPIRFFDEPKPPTINELLAVARDHDRTIKASWAI